MTSILIPYKVFSKKQIPEFRVNIKLSLYFSTGKTIWKKIPPEYYLKKNNTSIYVHLVKDFRNIFYIVAFFGTTLP